MNFFNTFAYKIILILPFVFACNSDVDYLDGEIDTMIIAHRGAWFEHGLKENSVEAMLKADDIRVYGSEIDVRFTKDWVGIICHDEKIGKMTIHEHTLDEIKAVYPQTIKLEYMLDKFKTTKYIKLIVEVKPMLGKENNYKCAELTTQMIHKKELVNRVEFLTFNPVIGKRLIELNPDINVFYLSSTKDPDDLKKDGYAGFNYYYPDILKNPQWARKASTKGMSAGAWTVNRQDDARELVRNGVKFIITDRPKEIKRMLIKERKRS